MVDQKTVSSNNAAARKFERNAAEFRLAAHDIARRFGVHTEYRAVQEEIAGLTSTNVPPLGAIVQRFQERDELLSWALEGIAPGFAKNPTDEDKATALAIVKLILLQARDAELAASYTPTGPMH